MQYRIIGVAAIIIVAFTAFTGIVIADEPPVAPRAGGQYAPISGADTIRVFSVESAIQDILQSHGPCLYTTRGDYPHISIDDGVDTVSAHGWWVERDGATCPEKATVTVWLEAYFCIDYPYNCLWLKQTPKRSDDVREGGGSGRRVNARFTCVSNNLVGWRIAVDVDIPGQFDPPDVVYEQNNVTCSPTD